MSRDSARILVRLGLLAGGGLALWLALSHIEYHWDWSVTWTYRALFWRGLAMTIGLSLGAIVLGLGLGLASGLASVSGNVLLTELSALYVELFRGTPLLVQVLIFYFCLGVVIHVDSPIGIGTTCLGLFSGAYISEMVRAGIESVDKGQWESALSSGLSHGQTLFAVILPQAVRRIIPPVTGQFVSCIKDSSLLSIISFRELTKAAEMVNATTYKTFEAYLPLALLYLLLTWPLSRLTRRLEKGISHERIVKSRL